jgi:hypothetical protein
VWNDEVQVPQRQGVHSIRNMQSRLYGIRCSKNITSAGVSETLNPLKICLKRLWRDLPHFAEASYLISFDAEAGCGGAVRNIGVIIGDTTWAYN